MKTDIEKNNIDAMNCFERALKRTGDIIGAFVLLILLSPLFLIIYIAQKLDGEEPALFSQERIGKDGKPFMIYKFRTMRSEDECVPLLAQKDDKRITKLGRFLREHHLDELPQLWNVLIGDMSFVGYRPERRYFIDKILEHRSDYELLYVSRPGVTSNATLYNGYTDTMDKMLLRLEMDLDYLRRRSIALDLRIITKTAFFVIGGRKF